MKQDNLWENYQTDFDLLKTFKSSKRYDFILSQIKGGSSVLNIGIGEGYFEKKCLEKGINIFSIDPSEKSIERLKKELNISSDLFKNGKIENIPFDSKMFDYVVACELLEHLDEISLGEGLLEINRVLKNNGYFIGTVPADENLSDNEVICLHCGKKFHRWGHQRSFSLENLRNILSKYFKEENIKRVYLFDMKYLNFKGKFIYLIKKLFLFINIKGSNETYFFKFKKIT
ncbi:MAG: class I SAM-dependent methyltransferase [Elusimicrobia bacterium]|nr:class I SAM-dependent methyltransferase [Elusimicrobiota bacterium]